MKGTSVEFPNRLNVEITDKDTVRGDSLTEFPATAGPWSVNPPYAHHGAGKLIKIAWKDTSGKLRSGMIAS